MSTKALQEQERALSPRLGVGGGGRILGSGESIGKDPRGALAWHLQRNVQQANIAGTDMDV